MMMVMTTARCRLCVFGGDAHDRGRDGLGMNGLFLLSLTFRSLQLIHE